MEMGRHCVRPSPTRSRRLILKNIYQIEWIDYCISERDDEGFKKRVSELEAARVVMLRETDLPSTATWQRGVHDQRSMRREIDRLREVEKFLLDRVRKLEVRPLSDRGPTGAEEGWNRRTAQRAPMRTSLRNARGRRLRLTA